MHFKICIAGCGDVGKRIACRLIESGVKTTSILAQVRSRESQSILEAESFQAEMIDFDSLQEVEISKKYEKIHSLYYLVPPQKNGEIDLRSKAFLDYLKCNGFTKPSKFVRRIVLISTTGVYGDCDGESVTEETPLNPTTERSQRRADMEKQWRCFADQNKMILSILRVPGIYSFSRLPRARLQTDTPVVNPDECGYTNRIHADDLAMICQAVMEKQISTDVYNVSDGEPGKLSQYLIDVANFLQLTPPTIVSLAEGHEKISTGMMSYITESRKIDNNKLLNTFNLKLAYSDYREGIQV
jgi:hypothetical protein